jgi:hypothetical protein
MPIGVLPSLEITNVPIRFSDNIRAASEIRRVGAEVTTASSDFDLRICDTSMAFLLF